MRMMERRLRLGVCFRTRCVKEMKELWNSERSVEEKWASMKLALCETAELVLHVSTENRKRPDWFQESKITLKTL